MAQPSPSRHIAQLERELGVSLFRRENKRMILIDDGILLRRRAEDKAAGAPVLK